MRKCLKRWTEIDIANIGDGLRQILWGFFKKVVIADNVALYVDDKTKLPESEWITSTYDGKVKKTVGKKYADFQISRFNVNAQPYYCLLDLDGNLLVTPRAYDLNIDEFVDFLDRGINEFNRRNNKMVSQK